MEHRSGMAIPKSPLVLMTLVLAGALTISLMAEAGPFKGHADLTGFQENPTLSSSATGTADVEISKDGNSVSWFSSARTKRRQPAYRRPRRVLKTAARYQAR